MFKDFLLKSIIKDLKVLKRLAGKVPEDQMDFRPKEGVRSTEELLQYLSYASTAILQYWLDNPDQVEFRTFMTKVSDQSKNLKKEDFPQVFENQAAVAEKLFSRFSDEELLTKEVVHPSGTTFKLGEAIIETSVKWLAAYKMQLFLYLKMSTDHLLTTPDLWRKFED